MGKGQLTVLSERADKEPVMAVQIEGKSVRVMIDTGATYTCVSTDEARHIPLSSTGRVAKTIGFSGQVQIIPFSAPITIEVNGKTVKMPILISEKTPVNLLGRDVLCRLGVQIKCTPDGLSLTNQMSQLSMTLRSLSTPQTKHIHWIRLLETGWENEIFDKWGTLIHDRHSTLRKPRCPSHCAVIVCEISCTGECEEQDTEWRKAMQDREQVKLGTQWVIRGAEGVAVQVTLDNKLHATIFNVPNKTPHVTLRVGLGYRARDINKMMESQN